MISEEFLGVKKVYVALVFPQIKKMYADLIISFAF